MHWVNKPSRLWHAPICQRVTILLSMATRNQALTGAVEGETGLGGHGVTLSLPRSDEIVSLHGVADLNGKLSARSFGRITQPRRSVVERLFYESMELAA
jgi:hypothetical protein